MFEKQGFLSQLLVPEATRVKFLMFQQRGLHSGDWNTEAPARIAFLLVGFNVFSYFSFRLFGAKLAQLAVLSDSTVHHIHTLSQH